MQIISSKHEAPITFIVPALFSLTPYSPTPNSLYEKPANVKPGQNWTMQNVSLSNKSLPNFAGGNHQPTNLTHSGRVKCHNICQAG